MDASKMSQPSVSNQATPGMYDWQDLRWPQAERKVFKLPTTNLPSFSTARPERAALHGHGHDDVRIVQPRLSRKEVSMTRIILLRSRMSAKVCAAERGAEFLTQSGETRREVSGPSGSTEGESRRGKEHAREAGVIRRRLR